MNDGGKTMIYTSYFAKLRKMPDNFHPIGITQYPPKWYDGLNYKDLAPTKKTLFAYKDKVEKDKDAAEKEYIESYVKETLGGKDVRQEIEKVVAMLPSDVQEKIKEEGIPIWENPKEHLVLMCFERSDDFCHRNIVSKWMRENGIMAREATDNDFEQSFHIETEIGNNGDKFYESYF